MITFKDFDWQQTATDLLFLIPNYKRGIYIRKTIDNLINTSIPFDKFKILIINDAIHEDFSDLKDKNVLYFTLERANIWERGDAFLRNIAIKYGQSKLIAQKDPEIVYSGDFIKGCFDHQNVLYRCGGQVLQARQKETEDYLNGCHNLNLIKQTSRAIPILEDRFVFFHYGWCINRELLKSIGGYDEDYKYYGYVDTDLYHRLMKLNISRFFDYDCNPVHLYHNKPNVFQNPTDIKREKFQKELFNKKLTESVKRNINKIWGEGDIDYIPEII